MTIALTGHVKIKKALQLSTYPNITTDKEAFEIVEKLIINTINKNFPNNENLVFVSGMAKGAEKYDEILNYENIQIKEIKKDYNKQKFPNGYFARNQAMIDSIDEDGVLLAFHRYDSSGVMDTLRRAKKANKKIIEF